MTKKVELKPQWTPAPVIVSGPLIDASIGQLVYCGRNKLAAPPKARRSVDGAAQTKGLVQ